MVPRRVHDVGMANEVPEAGPEVLRVAGNGRVLAEPVEDVVRDARNEEIEIVEVDVHTRSGVNFTGMCLIPFTKFDARR